MVASSGKWRLSIFMVVIGPLKIFSAFVKTLPAGKKISLSGAIMQNSESNGRKSFRFNVVMPFPPCIVQILGFSGLPARRQWVFHAVSV